MRFLTIVRHAKAQRQSEDGSDFSRALNGRGRRQCEQLRAWADDDNALGQFGPTTALVSAAARTTETFRRAFEGTAFVSHCQNSALIYNGRRRVTAEDVLIDLAAIDPVTTSLLVVGHNPTVLELLLAMASEVPEELTHEYPLAGAYVLALHDDEPVSPGPYEFVRRFVPDN
ncbi:MAG: SixA phosphatase family protein [Acidimicrobiales bacterium]